MTCFSRVPLPRSQQVATGPYPELSKPSLHPHIPMLKIGFNTRSVRKVSSHFEYLENRLRGLDVTWQPVRGDLTVHP